MGSYLLRRLGQIVPTLFFVSILIFGLQQLLPGDPAMILAGEKGDPGDSQRIQKPVLDLVAEKLPVTIELAALAILIALAIGITAGVVSAVAKDTVWDYAANV